MSEIDKYVKSTLLADTFNLMSTAPLYQGKNLKEFPEGLKFYKANSPQECGSLKLVVPQGSDGPYEDLYLYSRAEQIFEFLAGQKSYDFITSTQFQRLSKLQNMTSNNLTKAHYDLIYKNVVRRSENSQMDLNCFFEALEDIAQKLYHNTRRSVHDNLVDIISNVL